MEGRPLRRPVSDTIEIRKDSKPGNAERVAEGARELFNYPGKVILQVSADKDYLVDNPNRRCPVIAKARADLDYNPGISLDEGLKRSLIWYSDNSKAEEA